MINSGREWDWMDKNKTNGKIKLTDKVIGGIYKYDREDNNETAYIGSAKLTPSRTKENIFEKADEYHRKGETYNNKFKYSFTVFRTNLRRPLGEVLKMKVIVEPKEMTLEELLTLEGNLIQEGIEKGQCYLNHDPDPLKTWKKYNT